MDGAAVGDKGLALLELNGGVVVGAWIECGAGRVGAVGLWVF